MRPSKVHMLASCWWLTPVILATQEGKIRRIMVGSQYGQIACEALYQKYQHKKKKKKKKGYRRSYSRSRVPA
jgi:hypothetical protein